MENPRYKNSSCDKFSFPTVPIQDQESDSVTPADRLFFNGHLLPHVFISLPTPTTSYSRSSSSNIDSLMSSRSSSVSSRSSSCNSGRTSTSEASSEQRKIVGYKSNRGVNVINPQYGSSRRWQYITPTPVVLNRQVSRLKRVETVVGEEVRTTGDKTGGREGIGRRFFKSFVSACKECHAMEPSNVRRYNCVARE